MSVVSLPNWLGLLVALDLKSEVARKSQMDFLVSWSWFQQRCVTVVYSGVTR